MNTAIHNTQIAPSTYFYDPQLGVYITIRTIDPIMAKELLAGQHKNRNISPFSVNRYKEFMQSNQWVMNGEPIIFGGNKLIDGQHRLTACIQAGKSFQSVWIEFGGGTRASIPNHEINEWAKKYPHLGLTVKKCQGWYKNFRIKKGPFSTLHYMLRRSETHLFDFDDESADSNADKFFDSLCSGLDLSKGSPILPYRNHLLRMMSANEKISPHYIIRGGILSYNAWLTGQKTNTCRVGRITKIPKINKANA